MNADVKRLIGREFCDETVQTDMKLWPFRVINQHNKPKIEIVIRGETKTYFPEEVGVQSFTNVFIPQNF